MVSSGDADPSVAGSVNPYTRAYRREGITSSDPPLGAERVLLWSVI
jgi:hypothetical protein